VGTMGAAISLRVQSLRASRKVVEQIETPRSPDPIMRRPCADREEKRGPTGSTKQEQLDLNGPNQRGLSDPASVTTRSQDNDMGLVGLRCRTEHYGLDTKIFGLNQQVISFVGSCAPIYADWRKTGRRWPKLLRRVDGTVLRFPWPAPGHPISGDRRTVGT
jgi:hypothetical protein